MNILRNAAAFLVTLFGGIALGHMLGQYQLPVLVSTAMCVVNAGACWFLWRTSLRGDV